MVDERTHRLSRLDRAALAVAGATGAAITFTELSAAASTFIAGFALAIAAVAVRATSDRFAASAVGTFAITAIASRRRGDGQDIQVALSRLSVRSAFAPFAFAAITGTGFERAVLAIAIEARTIDASTCARKGGVGNGIVRAEEGQNGGESRGQQKRSRNNSIHQEVPY